MTSDAQRTRTIADYLEIVQRYKWLIALTTILVPLVAYVWSTQQPKVYEATAEVLLSRQDIGSVLTGIPTSNTNTGEPERYARTQAALARVPAVASLAISEARAGGMTTREFLASSSVSPRQSTDLLNFAVKDPDPNRATRLASAYATAFTTYKLRMDTTSLSKARRELQVRLSELRDSGGSNSETYRQLLQKSQDLRTLELLQVPASVVRRAEDASQVEPRPKRNAALGMMLGLMLGLGAAFVLSALDRRVRDAEEVERELGVPLLARLPGPRGRNDNLSILDRPSDEVAEAVSRLRTNFDFANSALGAKLLMVTSAGAKEGKTTTISNLAVALARTGRHVVLIDLDLRRPALTRTFSLPDRVGLTDAATGNATLDSVLTEMDFTTTRSWLATRRQADPDTGRLEVMTVGRARVDPAQFVETPGLTDILNQLRRRADLVLIDSPPILATGDAMALTAKVDGVLIVNRLGTLTRPALRDLARALSRSPAPTLGFVATGASLGETYFTYRAEERPQADVARLRRQPTPQWSADSQATATQATSQAGRWGRVFSD